MLRLARSLFSAHRPSGISSSSWQTDNRLEWRSITAAIVITFQRLREITGALEPAEKGFVKGIADCLKLE